MRETGWSDSLWNASSSQRGSLYSTTKSEYAIGDIITILIVEDISASTSASTDTDKESDLEVGFEGFDNYFGISHLFGRPISADPRFSVDAESEFDSSGDSERSSSVTGTVTGQVTEILSNGNLRIEASQTTVINGERNSIILLGTVRPQDISASNTIFSTQISNAELRYEGKGPLSNVQKRGILKEFLEYIWPF
jgi:flagellar L-ring protein precursor FlgH